VRIGREDAITEWLDPEVFTPPPGQGAITIEARLDRMTHDLAWVRACDHAPARAATQAERTFMRIIEGGCDVPLGAWARFDGLDLVCDGFVAAPDGSRHLRDRVRGRNPARVGTDLARRMLDAGAGDLAAATRGHERT
jgi:hydroxymethylbilane synthase